MHEISYRVEHKVVVESVGLSRLLCVFRVHCGKEASVINKFGIRYVDGRCEGRVASRTGTCAKSSLMVSLSSCNLGSVRVLW